MSKGQVRPGISVIVATWVAAILSVFLLVLAGGALKIDLGSFRSCSVNNTGIVVTNCGKQSLNSGDVLIGLITLGVLIVVICLFTHAWRISRRPAA